MSPTVITVTGPGGVINFEMEVIRAALEAQGIKVQVANDAPPDPEALKRVAERLKSGSIRKDVYLVAEHIPWGG